MASTQFSLHTDRSRIGILDDFRELDVEEQKRALNQLIKGNIEFSYEEVPAVSAMMKTLRIKPEDVTTLEDYLRLIPSISPEVIASYGSDAFLPRHTLSQKVNTLLADLPDYDIVQQHPLGGNARLHSTRADNRAVSLAIARELINQEYDGSEVITNHHDNETSKVLKDAIRFAGGTLTIRPSLDAMLRELVTGNYSTFLVPHSIFTPNNGEISTLYKNNPRSFENVGMILAPGYFNNPIQGCQVLSYGTPGGIFPVELDGRIITLPNLLVVRDSSGRSVEGRRGRIELSRLVGVYERDGDEARLIRGLEIVEKGLKEKADLDQGIYREAAEQIQSIIGITVRSIDDVNGIRQSVMDSYLRNSLVIGVPSGSMVYNFATNQLGQRRGNNVEIFGQQLRSPDLRYHKPREEISVLSRVYGPDDRMPVVRPGNLVIQTKEKGSLPEPPVYLNAVIDGEPRKAHLFDPSKDHNDREVLFQQPVYDRVDVLDGIEAARRNAEFSPTRQTTIQDISQILNLIYEELKSKDGFLELFGKKSGIPRKEIDAMVEGVPGMISVDGLTSMIENEQIGGSDGLSSRKVRSPYLVVSAGNMTFSDGFYVFAHLIMSKLGDQNDNNLSIFYRPSDTDLTSRAIIHTFRKVVSEVEGYQEKGLDKLFTMVPWSSRMDPDLLDEVIPHFEGGLYFGKKGTYQSKIEGAGKGDSNHDIYGEGLSIGVVLENLDRERLGDVVGNVLDKAYKLKASDCTTLHTIFVPENLYEDFYQVLREKARDLIVGNIIERETDLPQYDKKTLQKLDGAIKYMNGKAKKSESFSFEITQDVNVKKNQAGVILTRFNSVEEEDMELVGESHGVPFINVVKYKELDEARAGAQMIIDGYNLKTGIDQFMYIALFGKLQAEHKDMFQPLTYLVKENSASFDISRPHNGRYLVERMLI